MEVKRDNAYCAESEERDWSLMMLFTERADFFTSCTRCEEYSTIDGTAVRVTPERTNSYNVELKYREMPHDRYGGYFLECDKYAELRRYSDNGYIPLYINFFSDGYTAIWNVDPNKGGINVGQPSKIRSKDNYTSMQEKTCKYNLPLDEAVIYNELYERVQ